jgi:uncharacterized protein
VRRRLLWAGASALGLFVALNALAYRHAYSLTHFVEGGRRTPVPQRLSAGERVKVLVAGPVVPRPRNERTPADDALPFERHVFKGAHGLPLEAWLVPRAGARATVLLFHGHADSKQSMLPPARVLHDLGYATLLVDFHGSGGSAGDHTSVGFHESEDVAAAYAYVRALPDPGPIVLHGNSMGAVAVLKAVSEHHLDPAALVLECPFDRFSSTVRHRFQAFGIPAFPAADLLLLWGGVQQGFNPWRFNPADYASGVAAPTLLMNGGRDPWVSEAEARSIFDRLRGPRRLHVFPELGHQSFLKARRAEWVDAVGGFLAVHAGSARP